MTAPHSLTRARPPAPTPAADACRWLGAALVLVGVCARAITPFAELPYWDMDPLVMSSPTIGLGPAGLMALDAVIALGAVLIFAGAALAREAIGRLSLLVVGAFAAAVAWHGWHSPVGTLLDQYIGASWAGALLGALALAQACRDPRIRAGVVACLLGLIVALCVKGAVQLAIEHPATVEEFGRNKGAIFAAHNWAADSPMARAFERRVLQAEPTGWFALANVFGSFAGAGAVTFAALAFSCMRRRARDAALPVAGAAVACAAMALLSGSKGSLAALALGLVVVGVVFTRRCPTRRVLVGLALACIAAPIGAVLVRTLIGERLGELSLLFRGMYWQGAARMVAQVPLVGVGPGGFQAAFSVLKPPLCPEDVRSAHNVLVDWWSTLGLAGFAAGAVVVAWAVRAVAAVRDDRDGPGPDIGPLRPALRLALGVSAACVVLGAYLEMHGSAPLAAATRVGVLVAWALAAWAVARAGLACSLRPALAVGALTLLVQSQVEVTIVWPSSAALALALLAGAAPGPKAGTGARAGPLNGVLAAVFAATAGVLLVAFGVIPAAQWERELAEGARLVSPLPEVRAAPADKLAEFLSLELARPVAGDTASIEAARNELSRVRIAAAAEALARAWAHQPSDWRTGRELSGLLITLAQIPGSDPRAAARATEAAERGASLATGRSGAAVWAATVLLSIPNPDRDRADAWLVKARERDPYNPSLAYQLARVAADRGQRDAARERAREALRLQDLARLDPVGRGLGAAQLAQLRAWAADP